MSVNSEQLDREIKEWTEISEEQPRLGPCAVVHIPPTIRHPAGVRSPGDGLRFHSQRWAYADPHKMS